MRDDRGIADQGAAVVDGAQHQMLGHVAAATIGIVVNDHVAGPERLAAELL